MTLDRTTLRLLAEHLDEAELEARPVSTLTDAYPRLSPDDAYAIQRELRHRKSERGQRVIGYKIGLSSRAKMKQMNVDTPAFGLLFDYMDIADGGEVPISALIRPKVEAEIGFVLKRSLRGPGCHVGTVLAATDFVLPMIEVIDSRYENFRFDLASVIADNVAAARFVAGGKACGVEHLDLRCLGMVLEKNGRCVAMAAGAAVLGHPATAVAQLVNHLALRGEELPAGSLVLSGGATEAIAVAAGDIVQARFQDLGSVSLRFV